MKTAWKRVVGAAVAMLLVSLQIVLLAQAPKGPQGKIRGEEESAVLVSTGAPDIPDGMLATYTYTNATPVAIPDTGCGTNTTSVINVPDTYYVGSVTVGVCISHLYRGDLRIYLLGPDGTQVPLVVNGGSSGDNLNVTFDDTSTNLPNTTAQTVPPCDYPTVWRPSGTLGSFRFKPVAGNWTLQMCDSATPDAGTLNQWTLTFNDLPAGVYFTPASQTGYACPGGQNVYNYSVTNFTGASAAIDLAYASIWPATGPASTAVLAQGASEAISVRVKVDSAALPLSTDTLTITGSSGGYIGTALAVSNATMFGGWQDFADLPSPTTRGARWHSVVYYGGKLYKIGGYNAAGAAVRPYLDIYDIATNTWSAGADMPGNRTGIDCVEIGGKIYCAGGGTASGGTAQTTMYIYDIATNLWSTGAVPLPTARMDYAGVAIGTKYYLIGGYSGTTYLNTVVSYDTATSTWDTTIPAMSVARRWGNAGVMGGKIYVAGGFSTATLGTLTTQVYDPSTNTWAAYASMPASLPGVAAPITGWLNAADGVLQNRYFVMAGGYIAAATASTLTLLYDSVTNTWGPALPYMNHQLYGSAGSSDGTNLWLISGRQGDPAFHDGEKTTRLNFCPAPAPIVSYQSTAVADTCISVPTGDHNAIVDPGEILDLTVTLQNTGNTAATGVSAVLSTTTPGVTVTTATASFPDIPDFPTNTGASTTPYTVTVDSSVPCGTRIAFSLAVTTAQGPFTVPFSLLVGTLVAPVNIFTENFDGANTVPPGVPTDWGTTVVTPGATAPTWTTVTVGTYPTQAPFSAPNEAMFNSYNASAGSSIRLYRSAAVDLSAYPAASLSFRMYHDTGYTNLETVQVQVSTDGGTVWSPVGAPVYRYLGAGIIEWRSHTVDLSAYAGQASVMVGLLATSAYGNNVFVDDISLEGQSAACNVCPVCVITTCDATVPASALVDTLVNLSVADTTFPCTGTETYAWDFGDTATATGQAVTHTYTATGSYNWSVTVTVDGDTCTDIGTIVICPVITLAPAGLSDATEGRAYSQTITATGGAAPYGYAVTAGALPGGLTLSAAGLLSGAPTEWGTFAFTVTATDSAGCTGLLAYSLLVFPAHCGDITITTPALGLDSPDWPSIHGQQMTRLYRDGVPSVCSVKTCNGTSGAAGARNNDQYRFPNDTCTDLCITATLSTTCANQIFIAAYAGSFDPTDVCTNFIGDSGSSPSSGTPVTFQFTIPAHGSIVLVVNEVNIGGACPTGYTVDLVGLPCSAAEIGISSVAIASDVCGLGGHGGGNGSADPGEGLTFALTAANLGEGTATGVTATITTADPMVSITQNTTSFPDVPVCGTAANSGPNFAFDLSVLAPCGNQVAFTAHFTSNEGSWARDFTFPVTPAASVTLLNEAFETWPPAGWTIVNNGGDCDWDSNFNYGRANGTGGTGDCADADSDVCGSGTAMDTSLVTPAFDLSNPGFTSATLDYKTIFLYYAPGDMGSVEVTTDGITWDPLITYEANVGPVDEQFDLTPYLGNAAVQVRFTFVAPGWDWLWEVDDVKVSAFDATICSALTCCPTILLTPSTLPSAPAFVPYNQSVPASGGTGPYTYSISSGSLPTGLSLDPTSGEISGTPTVGGTYPFAVRAQEAGGCSGSQSYSVAVTCTSVPPVISGASAGCASSGVLLSTGLFGSYQWIVGGADIPGATSSTYTATASGTYAVRAGDCFGATATSAAFPVTVHANPVPTVSGASSGCVVPGVTLTTQTFSTYQWFLDSAPIPGATASSYVATQSGSYSVSVQDLNLCDGVSAAVAVTIYANPTPTISGPATACVSASLSTEAASSYQWYRNGSPISGAQSQSYSAPAPGSYTVQVSNSHGCLTTSAPFIVGATPTPTISGPSGGCTSVSLSTGVYASYQWLLGGSPIGGATAQSYEAVANGSYTVFVTTAQGCTATSPAKVVSLFAAPTISGASFNTCPATTVSLSTSAGYTTYQWRLNGSPISGATSSTYIATVTGNYSVSVIDAFGCSGTSADHTVFVDFCATTEVSPTNAVFSARLMKDAGSPTGFYLYFQRIDSVEGYNIYEGTVGTWYSHASAAGNVCNAVVTDLGTGEMRAAITPTVAGRHYYLVTGFGSGQEGPSGFATSGLEISAAQSTCTP